LNQNRALVFCFDAFSSREPVSTPDQVRGRLSLENALFDRNDEASDQSCDFVQMLGIMFRNGLREPNQAFVITQGRNVAGYDRRNRPEENGLGVGHGITSRKAGARTTFIGKSVFLALGSWRNGMTGSRFTDRRTRAKPM
jgi:hypothetical protein